MFFYLIIFLIVLIFIYKWGTNTHSYFKDKGIPFIKPVFFFGSNTNLITNKLSFPDQILEYYNSYPKEKIVGIFEFKTPAVFIRDPEIAKHIAVKDFDNFTDHRSILDEDVNYIVGKSLFLLKGQKWRDMRATLSPAFTGKKLRLMLTLVIEKTKQSIELIKSQMEKSKAEYDIKDLLTKFTSDIIATCSFGLDVNSFENPNNEFQIIGKKLGGFGSFGAVIKVVIFMCSPKLAKMLKLKVMHDDVTRFFQSTVIDVMKYRNEKGIIRHDMINLLMDAKKGNLVHTNDDDDSKEFAAAKESDIGKSKVTRSWTDQEIAAQAFLFFIAGFETVSYTMSFAAYELAVNPDVQEKLIREIDETRKLFNGNELSYENIQEMKYFDQVISEVLRKWPSQPVSDRICQNDYILKYDDKDLLVEKGRVVLVPIFGIHRDKKYYPNPEKFDPERFSEENKPKLNLDAYMPFGLGPRNCIGSRFALMEMKTILFYLLSNFTLNVCEKTQIPIKFAKTQFSIKTEKGIWVELKQRN